MRAGKQFLIVEPFETESPIEAMFADAVRDFLADGYRGWGQIEAQVSLEVFDFHSTREACYRVDFLLYELDEAQKIDARLVVECDGHDWHDRTKEQAERDRHRDRALLAAGYPVMRFTGSEIYREARNCAETAFHCLALLLGARLRPPPEPDTPDWTVPDWMEVG